MGPPYMSRTILQTLNSFYADALVTVKLCIKFEAQDRNKCDDEDSK